MTFSKFFSETAEPADNARLTAIEHAIGRALPDDYRALIKETGGGTLKLDKCVMPGLPEGVGGLATDDIFGNGSTSTGRALDLATDATYLMEEWEIPAEVLLFATTEDGMHNCFVINYDLPDYPTGVILHLDTDPGGKMTQVADSVTDFLTKLEPYDDSYAEGANPDADQEGKGIEGVWHGKLSDDLTRAIAATPTPDMEYLLRKAVAPLANSFGLSMMHNSNEGRRFQDLLYWVAQHVQPHPDPLTYMGLSTTTLTPNMYTLIGRSFLADGQKYGFIWNQPTVEWWWKIRVEYNIMTKTPAGYILDEDYINTIIENLRKEDPITEV
ncbi:SMI1/KNR4 family protein [Corynebacterium qintianiae]|uniref:SMI1/KNR4 family protein n=1 Tax=Corynebacterium qintianiae TaxID=2709392 RepID=A0A7T0PGB4_9CORY|nr:SMI1/KNR4 family protein [Corynebacterium qintianiae]QPK83672.1 SMI1/KNR4 family protein [Corynebacterium qintianiae]